LFFILRSSLPFRENLLVPIPMVCICIISTNNSPKEGIFMAYNYNSMFKMSTGASSGMDWGSMVDTILAAKRKQYEPLETKKETLQLKIGLFQEMSNNFKAVQKSLTLLTQPSTYKQKEAQFTVYSPSGADAANIISATPTTDAMLQNWDINIKQLAKNESRISTRVSDRSEALGLEGTFTVNVGGGRGTIEVKTTDSLLDINYKIANATDDITGQSLAVDAQLIDNRMVISSLESGLGSTTTRYVTVFRGDFTAGTGGTDYLARTPEERLVKDASTSTTIGNPVTGSVPPSVTIYESDGTTPVDKADYSYDPTTGELSWGALTEGDEYVVKWDYPPYVAEIKAGDRTYRVGIDFDYDNVNGTIHWNDPGLHPSEGDEYTVYFSNTVNVSGTGADTTDISSYVTEIIGPPPPLTSTRYPSAEPLEITAGGSTYTEGTDFTFDRDTGVIDWTLGGTVPAGTDPGVGLEMSINVGTGDALTYHSNVFTLEAGTGDDILGFFNLDATSEGAHWVKAQDAILDLNGVEVRRSSNTIDDLVGSTTLELKNTGHVGMEIVLDTEQAITTIQSFVTAYNDAMDWINIRLSEEQQVEQGSSDWKTSDDFNKKFGLLHGNSVLWQTKSRLRQLISNPVETLGPLSMLSQLGITTEKANYGKSGKIEFDQSMFMEALTPGAVPFYDQWMTDSLTSSTEPLGDIRDGFKTGSFSITVGGKATTISVTERDTLTTLAQKINDAKVTPTGSGFSFAEPAQVRAKITNNTLSILSKDIDEDLYIQDSDGVLKSLGLDVTLPNDSAHHVQGTEYFVAEMMTASMEQLNEYMTALVSATPVDVGGRTSTPDGRIASEIYFMQQEVSYIDKRIEDYERQISITEKRLWTQYAAAEQSIALYSAQLASISKTFANWSGGGGNS
jgi:flagellar capping protein FliD